MKDTAKTLFVSQSLLHTNTFLLDIRIAPNQCIASRKGHGSKYPLHENQDYRSGTTVSDIASAIETNSKFGLRVQLMRKTEMKMALRWSPAVRNLMTSLRLAAARLRVSTTLLQPSPMPSSFLTLVTIGSDIYCQVQQTLG